MDKYVEGYEKYFEGETMKEKEQGNKLIIAGKPFEVYVYNWWLLSQKYDQIEIEVADRFVEKAIYLIKGWQPDGWVPEKNKNNPDGRILFVKTEEDIMLRDKKKLRENICRITMTRIPALFMYTRLEEWERDELEEAKRKAEK